MNCSKFRIKNAWLVAGDGSGPRRGELLVSCDGRILAEGGPFIGEGGIIDGSGKLLAPGFIDAHGHSDVSVLACPDGFSKISQGVTTEIAGNCGLSAFPLTDENREHLKALYAEYGVSFAWNDYPSYREALQKKGCVPDVIPLCGHNTLRAAVAGYEKKVLSPAELGEMKRLLALALDAGSPGLSTGLLYVPGKFASEGEIVELMKVLARHDAVYATHLASEGDGLLEALDQTLDMASAAGLKKVQISHFKTAGPANWGKLSPALERIFRARSEGIRVTVDRYPYTESMTQLSVILPGEWADMDDVAVMRKLRSAEARSFLADRLRQERAPDYWKRVRLVSTGAASGRDGLGKFLSDLSPDPALFVAELLAGDSAGTCAAFSGMSAENLDRIMSLDFCMPGSDGNALSPGYRVKSHPRAFGTAPRFLHRLLERNIPVGEAVRRACGLPAETFSLEDRGRIAPGLRADLVLFDPDELQDTADFSSPDSPARGILWVMSAGVIAYRS
ncbi:MAG: amidohydrolase family protein [Lentisphaeria bacterium]|nr:amidohydrolase family protein [Lentisphaeria bacterium]